MIDNHEKIYIVLKYIHGDKYLEKSMIVHYFKFIMGNCFTKLEYLLIFIPAKTFVNILLNYSTKIVTRYKLNKFFNLT